jgi:hypothetical protein
MNTHSTKLLVFMMALWMIVNTSAQAAFIQPSCLPACCCCAAPAAAPCDGADAHTAAPSECLTYWACCDAGRTEAPVTTSASFQRFNPQVAVAITGLPKIGCDRRNIRAQVFGQPGVITAQIPLYLMTLSILC